MTAVSGRIQNLSKVDNKNKDCMSNFFQVDIKKHRNGFNNTAVVFLFGNCTNFTHLCIAFIKHTATFGTVGF